MNKKYIISNSKNSIDDLSCYLFYIILILVSICFLSKMFSSYESEYFAGTTPSIINITSTPTPTSNKNNDLIIKNEQLSKTLNSLQEKLLLQERTQYIANNYNKIVDSSFPDELNFLNVYFTSIDLPKIDLSTYNVISSQSQFDDLIKQAKEFVNFYKIGDIVTKNSTFNIDKNTICYKNTTTPISNEYIISHPDCMACSINDDYENTKSWKNTKTNIDKVCLFNNNASPNSGIPNLSDCTKLCSST